MSNPCLTYRLSLSQRHGLFFFFFLMTFVAFIALRMVVITKRLGGLVSFSLVFFFSILSPTYVIWYVQDGSYPHVLGTKPIKNGLVNVTIAKPRKTFFEGDGVFDIKCLRLALPSRSWLVVHDTYRSPLNKAL